jgi:hypothetical protein
MKHPFVQVSFRPNVKLISTVRKFTEEFYQRLLDDRAISEKVALATHELLENAVAYASDGDTSIRVEMGDDELTIKTWNRTSPERQAALVALIGELEKVSDPDAHYQRVMNHTAYRTDGSGLGLIRIMAEAEMKLGVEVQQDGISVIARTKISAKEHV